MKSAFFILIIFFPAINIANTFTIANQNGKVKSVNIINYKGFQYSDFEYTTSCIIDNIKSDFNKIDFDNKSIEAIPNAKFVLYSLYSQIIAQKLSTPVLVLSNRVCVPIKDFIYALDSLGICKIISTSDNYFKIDDYAIFKNVPKISNFSNQYNLAYFEQVFNEVNKKQILPAKKNVLSIKKSNKTLNLIKDALKEDKSEVPTQSTKRDTYYDIPRGLNRDNVLKKKD